MNGRSLYLVTGWCQVFGRCQDIIWAVDKADAAARFLQKHGVNAQELRYEHA